MKVNKYYLHHIFPVIAMIVFGVQLLYNNTWFKKGLLYGTQWSMCYILYVAHSMCYIFLSEIKNAFPVFTNLGPLITLFSVL